MQSILSFCVQGADRTSDRRYCCCSYSYFHILVETLVTLTTGIDFAGSEGLQGMKVDYIKPVDYFVFAVGHVDHAGFEADVQIWVAPTRRVGIKPTRTTSTFSRRSSMSKW